MKPNMPRRPRDNRPVEVKMYDERVIFINRVARVVKGGRRFRFQALVVLGDHKGKVGMGIAKGADVSVAVTKATEVAKKNVVRIPIYKSTLTHDVEGKMGGAKIMIKPASPGTGLIAGGVVRIVLEVAGIENAMSKSHGSSNKINVAYATLEALGKMQTADKWQTNKMKKSEEKPIKPQATAVVAKKTATALTKPDTGKELKK